MYEQFYGLREKPFNLVPDPQYLYLGKSHREALNHLLYGINEHEGFMVITGEIGVGKTTICRALLERLEPRVRSALILNPIISELELLTTILEEFGMTAGTMGSGKGRTRKDLIDQLNECLLQLASQGDHAVLIIDEAQNLSLSVLEQIRLMSNLETHKEKLLQIILVGQVELAHKLALPELAQLNQRVSIRYHIGPLAAVEVKRYVNHRLRVAGSQGAIVFSEKAFQRIFRYSRGIPRLTNLACDRALLAGFQVGSPVITPQLVNRGLASLAGEGQDRKESRRAYVAIILLLLAVIAVLAYENPTATRLLGGLRPTQGERSWQEEQPVDARSQEAPLSPRPPAKAIAAEPNIPASERPASVSKGSLKELYTVHLGSYREGNLSHAQYMVDLLSRKGYKAYISTVYSAAVEGPEKGVWHRVLVGDFSDEDEAIRVMSALKRQGEFPYARLIRK